MKGWALPAPVLPGQTEHLPEVAEHIRGHMADYEESRAHAGITLERVFLQRTPAGDVIVNYSESARSFTGSTARMMTSGLKFDAWFLEMLHEVHGVDVTTMPLTDPEQILDYSDAYSSRGRGLAFCAPVSDNGVKQMREFTAEAMTRTEEFRRSRTALKMWLERAFITETPMGSVLSVYLEGTDPVAANATWARSQDPFDLWFRAAAGAATGLDFDQPVPPVECIWDWVA